MTRPACVDVALLQRVPYFAALPEEVLAALVARAVERCYDRGQTIFLEGEACAGLYVVAWGEVKIFKMSPQGREQILHRLVPGDTFNDVAVLDGGPNPASAAAISEAGLCMIARADIRRLAQAYPALAWALIESVARRTRHLVEMVEDLALRSVKERLARLLLAEVVRTPAAGSLDRSRMMSQAEMAARLGTVREMIGRALRDLDNEGVISLDRHRIVVRDAGRLAAIANGF